MVERYHSLEDHFACGKKYSCHEPDEVGSWILHQHAPKQLEKNGDRDLSSCGDLVLYMPPFDIKNPNEGYKY